MRTPGDTGRGALTEGGLKGSSQHYSCRPPIASTPAATHPVILAVQFPDAPHAAARTSPPALTYPRHCSVLAPLTLSSRRRRKIISSRQIQYRNRKCIQTPNIFYNSLYRRLPQSFNKLSMLATRLFILPVCGSHRDNEGADDPYNITLLTYSSHRLQTNRIKPNTNIEKVQSKGNAITEYRYSLY